MSSATLAAHSSDLPFSDVPSTDSPSAHSPSTKSPAAPTGPSFADLGLGAVFVTSLSHLDITQPTPVQIKAIPLLLAGRDLIASAPTGTGKTAAFLLPAFVKITSTESRRGRGPRILVLTPTRELAQQVAKASQSFSRQLPRFSTVCVTGGESYTIQNRQLSAPHEVLIATPCRLMDQMNSGRIDFSRVDVLILDEADRMLDMGFSEDVLAIARALPADRQTVCFSATLSRGVRTLADQLLRNPEWLEVEHAVAADDMIDQHVIYVDGFDHRNQLLEACLADEGLGQALIFTSTKRHAEELAGQLQQAGHGAEALHGDLSQKERTRALNKLRRGECKVLVATDVAARGIDVASITHVINFNLPKFAEDYVHRIGRTGRAGATGQAVSFVGREDVFTLRKIEHFIGRKVQVSEIDGMAARFKPTERQPSPGSNGTFRKPAYGKAGYGKPSYGKTGYSKPGYGATGGAPGEGKPGYGKHSYGKPAHGKPAYGKPAYDKPAYAKPAYAKRDDKGRDFSGGGFNGARGRQAA